jgi:hypothetical protein
MAHEDTLLAILEPDCMPATLIDRAAWIAKTFDLKIHRTQAEVLTN